MILGSCNECVFPVVSSQCQPLLLYCFAATEVAQDLRKYIVEIYGDFLSSDGLVCSYTCR